MSKNFLTIIFIVFFTTAFTLNQEENTIKWFTNYREVMALAAKTHKPVLIFFHGSDWCPPCIKMQKEVFMADSFVQSVSQKILFLDVDFPYKKPLSEKQLKHNMEVKKKFGLPGEYKEGFPQVVIINADGKVLHQEKGYNGGGPAYLMNLINDVLKEQ